MLRYLLDRPISVIMTSLAMMIISIAFIQKVPVSLLPNVPIPEITVRVKAPQLDARTLENSVTRILRNQLLQVNHLKDIHSRSSSGRAVLHLTLEYGVNTSLSSIEINEKIDQVLHLLPRSLERPRVIKSNVSDIPIFNLLVVPKLRPNSLQSMMELSEFAEKVIKRRLEHLNEIAFVDMHGRVFPEILVRPDKNTLISLGVTEAILEKAIRDANFDLGNVLIKDGDYQYNIGMNSRLLTVEDIESIQIRVEDKLFQLKDLAIVDMSEQEEFGSFFSNGRRAIVMTVRKKSSANNYVVHKRMCELLDVLKTDYPHLEFRIANDQLSLLKSSLSSLQSSLVWGISVAGFILFTFFRDWRFPMLIILVVPVSLLITLFSFYLLNISVNIISLTGLILGVGLMIDNSIIILESIRQKQLLYDGYAAIEAGTNDVIRPLISSALTTSSVFLPLILLSGMAGALFYDQALAIAIGLLISVAVSYFVLPVLASLLIKRVPNSNSNTEQTWHDRLVAESISKRMWLLPFLLLLGTAVFLMYQYLPKKAFPDIPRKDFQIHVDWNEQIDLDENERRGLHFYEEIRGHIESMDSYVGEQQFLLLDYDQNINETSFMVSFSNVVTDSRLEKLSQYLKQSYPQAIISITQVDNVFDRIFDRNEATVVLEIQSNQSLSLPPYLSSNNIADELKSLLPDVQAPPSNVYVKLEILSHNLLIYKVLYSDVLDRLRSLLGINRITDLHDNDRTIPIQVSAKSNQDLSSLLVNQTISNTKGFRISLSKLIKVHTEEDYKYIEAGRHGEAILFPTDQHIPGMEKTLQKHVNSLGPYTIQFSGSYYENRKLIEDLLQIGMVVFTLLFLILAAQFESLIQPLIVALTLPVGVLGALFGLYICGESINVMALVGIIIMIGIDVNDAILKIDIINRNRRGGMPLLESIIDGSKRRLRPIILTSLTTILAMTPILFSSGLGADLQRPMAVAVIGGLLFGTVASIVMIPMLYSFLGISIVKQ